jgi:hypothetical protein
VHEVDHAVHGRKRLNGPIWNNWKRWQTSPSSFPGARMNIDDFKLRRLVCQLKYDDRFEVWDSAGRIARRMTGVWNGLKLVDGQPQQQTLRAPGVEILTGINMSNVVLSGALASDGSFAPVHEAFSIWRDELKLDFASRVSTRAVYMRDFSSLRQANAELLALGLARWPAAKVFDQPVDADRNSVELVYRFEDPSSFALLRLKTESVTYTVELDRELVDIDDISKTKDRLILDFDRGLLERVDLQSFRMDEWLSGCKHLLRRDLQKVIGAK